MHQFWDTVADSELTKASHFTCSLALVSKIFEYWPLRLNSYCLYGLLTDFSLAALMSYKNTFAEAHKFLKNVYIFSIYWRNAANCVFFKKKRPHDLKCIWICAQASIFLKWVYNRVTRHLVPVKTFQLSAEQYRWSCGANVLLQPYFQ